MDWFAQAVLRNIVNRAVQHRLPHRWEGLDEADTVDCVKNVLQGLGLICWREYPYNGGGGARVDISTESLVPGDAAAACWVEVKRMYDGELRLSWNRFALEILNDFQRLNALVVTADHRAVVWVVNSDHAEVAKAGHRIGRPAPGGTYTVGEAVDQVHQVFGLRPYWVSVDMSCVAAVAESARYLHVLLWWWLPVAPDPGVETPSATGTEGVG